MSQKRYVGRHRTPAQAPHAHRLLIPLALVSATVAGGAVVSGAAASALSSEAATVETLSSPVLGLGSAGRDQARAAVGSDRAGARAASRGLERTAVASVVSLTGQKATDVGAAAGTARKAAAAKAAAVKAEAAKKAAEAARQKAQRWVAPISNYTLTSGFGWRWGRMHPAQDLAAPVGTPVRALSSGTVTFAGWSDLGYGNLIQIRYWDGTVSWYAHNSQLLVGSGDKVEPGQVVAHSGNTGNSTGPHLHLEIHPQGGESVSPPEWLAQRGVDL